MKRSISNSTLHKNISRFSILSSLNKSQVTKERILKQLEQLDLDVSPYLDLSLKDLIFRVDQIMKNTYSIKYLGLNKNQMGIISRRINPLTDQKFKVEETNNDIFNIHKYFYPKPLKTGGKRKISQKINTENIQEKIKKDFERKTTEKEKKIEDMRKMRLSTKVVGGWQSIQKQKQNRMSVKKNGGLSINQLAHSIVPKAEPSKSFSKFLSEGILIIRN